MDIKTLTALARACRRLGVSHLKTAEVELDLRSDVTPATRRRRTSAPANEALFNEPDAFKQQAPGGLSETDLLFWSSSEQLHENHS